MDGEAWRARLKLWKLFRSEGSSGKGHFRSQPGRVEKWLFWPTCVEKWLPGISGLRAHL